MSIHVVLMDTTTYVSTRSTVVDPRPVVARVTLGSLEKCLFILIAEHDNDSTGLVVLGRVNFLVDLNLVVVKEE
jgi:hypothetical protein